MDSNEYIISPLSNKPVRKGTRTYNKLLREGLIEGETNSKRNASSKSQSKPLYSVVEEKPKKKTKGSKRPKKKPVEEEEEEEEEEEQTFPSLEDVLAELAECCSSEESEEDDSETELDETESEDSE